ncbi:MAG: hypothetical protein M3Y87_02680 [Myxococcota bacterium]|nr:hypothetical protein [Myxococcota bacterium]
MTSARARDAVDVARLLGIAPGARERVIERFESGQASRSELVVGRAKVGVLLWSEEGRPSWAWSIRRGKKHGLELEWPPRHSRHVRAARCEGSDARPAARGGRRTAATAAARARGAPRPETTRAAAQVIAT